MNKRLLILIHHAESTYRFRRELIEQFKTKGYEVHISVPDFKTIEDRMPNGLINHEVNLNRHGVNPLQDFKLYRHYCKLIKQINPNIIFSYTIKPNIYGSIAAHKYDAPIIPNITGLGSTFKDQNAILFKIVKILYKIAFKHVPIIFFQNEEGRDQFIYHKLIQESQACVIPGSGVNTSYFIPMIKVRKDTNTRFLFIARIMFEKGIIHFISCAKRAKKAYPTAEFQVAGMIEEIQYEDLISMNQKEGIIEYLGDLKDIRQAIKEADCIVLPSFYPEGMSNVLLEAAAMEKPVITTNVSGCKETVEDEITGFLCKPNDTNSLWEAIEKFLMLPKARRESMGKEGRKKVMAEFDRNIVVKQYLETAEELEKRI